ncbi:bacterial Ig-like domain-containing protein [Evansella sp. AB-rgal1]|uniref:bacterial Ig-like domain-containing protein n=1 Tax=Evansella sp. AB-rgal1 TaxID=3242696 RepID=UPI00359CFAFF
MRKRRTKRKLSAIFLSMMIFLSTMNLAVLAEGTGDLEVQPDPLEGMINISSDWQGSVFYTVGGQDKITAQNFAITENPDNTVTLRSSNNRGKIASGDEGITYYFKDIPEDANFEFSATVQVDSWTTDITDNQVAFGLMLRGDVLHNVNKGDGGHQGSYVAVGAVNQVMHGFYKNKGGSYGAGTRVKFDRAVAPAAGQEYDLRIQKMGNTFVVSVGEETHIIDGYTGEVNYAGLFTSRNTTVTFSNVNLAIEGQLDLGDWEFSAFGDNTNITNDPPRNPDPIIENGSVRLEATGGKISSGVDGISFYHKEIPANANFEITTKAQVNSFKGGDNQVSFGLMLRDAIGAHGTTGGHEANYVAVGGLDLNNTTIGGMKGFYKVGAQQTKLDPVGPPVVGETYDLSIRKSGDTYVVTVNGVASEPLTLNNLFTNDIFAGLYVARGADITFSDFNIHVDTRTVTELNLDSSEMNTQFLLGQSLDLTELKVTAVFDDGTQQALSPSDYIVTGFNSNEVGNNTITINYNGVTAQLDLTIVALSVTELEIKYLPAKTVYYKGDKFDPQGIVVVANYENGYKYADLASNQYSFFINDEPADEYIFQEAGAVVVTVRSEETLTTTTTFTVNVKDAVLRSLEVRQLPAKTVYFLDDELDLSGISVYANYSDNSSVRLLANEYEITNFDSTVAGTKELTLTHKERTTSFHIEVKVKELTNIEVTTYPQTTFYVEDEFTHEGLTVSTVYDNGDRVLLDGYAVDSSAFDSTTAGTYDIAIVPTDDSIEPITYKVTVREAVEVEWKKMRFGQSTSNQRNYVDVREDGTIKVVAEEGGGKITQDHDGIAFYYTEVDATEDNFVLSADIKVIEYAKTQHDGQESFGIMARDAINSVQDASVFSTNIAAIGGFSGGTRDENGTQFFVRTGVLAPDGEGSRGIQKHMLENVRPTPETTESNYRLTLSKTNSGYVGQLNNGEEVISYTPDILNVQDGNIYVGFYAARLATIEVSNIDFSVTATATDAPKVLPPAERVSPELDILSLKKTPLLDYDLIVRSNVDGVVTVRQGQTVIASEVEVEAGKQMDVDATLVENGNTNFSLTFLPDDTQYLTSYAPIVRNFTVQTKSFEGDIYVSPAGRSDGSGTKESPLNIDTAIDFVKPGQTIYVMEGTYVRNSRIEIKMYNDGTEEAMKNLFADPEATTRPVFDLDNRYEGFIHSGNYWHVKGIDITKSGGNLKPYHLGGSHNIIENISVYANGDTGFQISRTDSSQEDKSQWPAHNLVLNSIAFDNRDPSENNADGFAAKLTVGEGNVFDGCVSHNNIDDGWDLYTKVGTGAIGAVTIKNSIAFNNGTLTNGHVGNAGKNGFKLGGEGVHVPHVIKNSVAFGNGYFGFTSNSNPGLILENNIGFNNIGANLSMTTYAHIPEDFTINGFASYRTNLVENRNDNYPTNLATVKDYSDVNFMFRSGKSVNGSGIELSNNISDSLQQLFILDDSGNIVAVKRDANGVIQWGDLWETYNGYMEEPTDANPETPTQPEQPSEPSTPTQPVTPIDGNLNVGKDVKVVKKETSADGKVKQVVTVDTDKLVETVRNATSLERVSFAVDTAPGDVAQVNLPIQAIEAISTKNASAQVVVSTKEGAYHFPVAEVNTEKLAQQLGVVSSDVTISITISETEDTSGAVVKGNLNLVSKIVEFKVFAVSGEKSLEVNRFNSYVEREIVSENIFNPKNSIAVELMEDGTFRTVPTVFDGNRAIFRSMTNSKYTIVQNDVVFPDVAADYWAKSSIDTLASKYIFRGFEDGEFKATNGTTRAQLAVLITRSLGLTSNNSYNDEFKDVRGNEWFVTDLIPAIESGIILGFEDGTFRGNEFVTREQAAAMFARALQLTGFVETKLDTTKKLTDYKDQASIPQWVRADAELLLQAGIMNGRTTGFVGKEATNRAETAKLLEFSLRFINFMN